MLWTKDDLPPDVKTHRAALKAQAAAHRYVVDGKPYRFTEDEIPRIAFLAWRIETGRLDPHEGGKE